MSKLFVVIAAALRCATLIGAVAALSCKIQRSQVNRYVRKRQIIGEAAAIAVDAIANEDRAPK